MDEIIQQMMEGAISESWIELGRKIPPLGENILDKMGFLNVFGI